MAKRVARPSWVRRYRWWIAGVVVLALAAGLTVALWPATPAQRALPPTRARQYLAFDACLLTSGQGLADPATAPVWAGMQDASAATRAKVSYLAASGPQTVGNAVPYANSLLQRHCDVVLAVGAAQVDAINQTAPDYPHATFVVVGGKPASRNVNGISAGPAGTVRSSVAALITGMVH